MTTLIEDRLDLAQRAFKWADIAARKRVEWMQIQLREQSTIWAEMDITDYVAYVRTQAREALAARRRAKRYLREVEAGR